jgi:hypothetical protein
MQALLRGRDDGNGLIDGYRGKMLNCALLLVVLEWLLWHGNEEWLSGVPFRSALLGKHCGSYKYY